MKKLSNSFVAAKIMDKSIAYKKVIDGFYQTTDYESLEGMFVNSEGANRPTISRHIKRLKKSMLHGGLDGEPIFNSVITLGITSIFGGGIKMKILDGQNRVSAALQLAKSGGPKLNIIFRIEFIETKQQWAKTFADLNSLQEHLKTKNYGQIWEFAENPEYLRLKKVMESSQRKRKEVGHTIALDTLKILAYKSTSFKDDYKEGKFTFKNFNFQKQLNQLFDMQDLIGRNRVNVKGVNLASMAGVSRGMIDVILHPNYNHNIAMKLLSKPSVANKIDLSSKVIARTQLEKILGLKSVPQKQAKVKELRTVSYKKVA